MNSKFFLLSLFFLIYNTKSLTNDICENTKPEKENDCLGQKSNIGICCYLGYKLNDESNKYCKSVLNKAVFLNDIDELKKKYPDIKDLNYECDPDNSVIDDGGEVKLDENLTTFLYYFNSVSKKGKFSLTSNHLHKYMSIYILSNSGVNNLDYEIKNGKNTIRGYLYSYNSMVIPKDFYSGKKIDISFVCSQKCYFILNIFFNDTSGYFNSYLKTEFNLVPEFNKMVDITFNAGNLNHSYFSYVYSQKKSKELDFVIDNKKIPVYKDDFFSIKFGEFSLNSQENISLNIQSETNDVLTISNIANSKEYDPELFLTDYTFMGALRNEDPISYSLLSDKNASQIYQIRITANKKISAVFEGELKYADENNMVIFQYNTTKSPYSLSIRKNENFAIYRIQLLEVTDNSKSDNWIDPLILNVNSPDKLTKDGVKYYPLDISNRKKDYRYIFKTTSTNKADLSVFLTKCKSYPDCVYTKSSIKKISKKKASKNNNEYIIKSQEDSFEVNDILLVQCDSSSGCEYSIVVNEEPHKSNSWKNLIIGILIFFGFLILLAISYFIYIHYFKKSKTILIEDIGNLVNNENKNTKEESDNTEKNLS